MHNHITSHLTPSGEHTGKTIIWTLVLNLLITITQFVAGTITGMLALIADATHNLSDIGALLVAYWGEASSRGPATKTETYGRKRIEVFATLISASALTVVAGFIIYEAYERLITPTEVSNFPFFVIAALMGLLGNIGSVVLLRRSGSKSLNMKMAVLHMAYDAATSLAVLIGGILIYFLGWWFVDIVLSVGIAVVIVWSSLDVYRQVWRVFMEAAPSSIDFDEVVVALESNAKVENIHDLHIWSLSSTEVALSCHVCVKSSDLSHTDQVIAELNDTLNNRFKINHSTLQIESVPCESSQPLCGNGAVS